MISKTNRYYLEELKKMATDNEAHFTTDELSKKFFVCRDHARTILMILQANGNLRVLKTKGRISGVRFTEN